MFYELKEVKHFKEITDFKSLFNNLKKQNVSWVFKKHKRNENPSEDLRWGFYVNMLNDLRRFFFIRIT